MPSSCARWWNAITRSKAADDQTCQCGAYAGSTTADGRFAACPFSSVKGLVKDAMKIFAETATRTGDPERFLHLAKDLGIAKDGRIEATSHTE